MAEASERLERKKTFPRRITLKDGRVATIRLMVKKDKDKLLRFFRSIPEEERLFLRDDVTKPETIEAWARDLDYSTILPIVAEIEGRIVADATLHRRPYGWMQHVAEVRMVVDPAIRGKGLARALLAEILDIARTWGMEILVSELIPEQKPAINLVKSAGFKREATLQRHVKDLSGTLRDLLILTRRLTEDEPRP
jgi:L-amino acid N-acyltransferase YncA